jgi:ABC-type enterochelin transport system substrate-binding protein
METIGKVFARAEKAEARVKELEVELSKLKRSYDIMSAYAVHYVPEHKTQELIKDVNEAYK